MAQKEINKTMEKAKQMVVTTMDLETWIQEAVAAELAKQQQQTPPAPAIWGISPNQPIMY